MPRFKFLLTDPELWLEAEKDSETCTLFFDAKIQPIREEDTLTIFYDNQKCDGFSGNGTAIVRKRMPNDGQLAKEGFGSLSVYPPDFEDPEESPPHFPVLFEISISLPADTFLRLVQADPKTHLIHLWLTTENQKEGLGYGNNPEGHDMEWRPEKTNSTVVESIVFKIRPRPDNALGSELSSRVEQLEPPLSASRAVDTSKLVSAVNRLFWLVVIIGLLLVLRAL